MPLLCLNAADDPLMETGLARLADGFAAANSNIISVVTSHGGHLGWVEGWRRQWMSPAIAEFLVAADAALQAQRHGAPPAAPPGDEASTIPKAPATSSKDGPLSPKAGPAADALGFDDDSAGNADAYGDAAQPPALGALRADPATGTRSSGAISVPVSGQSTHRPAGEANNSAARLEPCPPEFVHDHESGVAGAGAPQA